MDAIYLRKSRIDLDAEKSGSGNTLLRHKSTLIDLAKRQDRHIGEIYEEVRSGESIAARPEMQRLLQDVENGKWEAVLVMEVERLARGDSIDQGIVSQAFKYSGTKIITPAKTYDPNNEFDEEYFEFGLFMSRREYKSIRRRLEAGKIAAIKEGKYLGKTAPYGYERVRIENGKGWTLRAIPEEAEIVRRIFDMHVTKGYGIYTIARILNANSIPTSKGGTWHPGTIRGILQNIIYAGYVYWGRRPAKKTLQSKVCRSKNDGYLICKGLHEPIISKELFDASQVQRKTNPGAPVHKDKKLANPFQGVLYCKKCGCRMQLNPRSGRTTPSINCRNITCDMISSQLPVVERTLLAALNRWLSDYKINVGTGSYANDLENRIKEVQSTQRHITEQLHQQETQMNKAYEMLELGVYSPEEFTARRESISQKKLQLQENLQQATKQENECRQALVQRKEIVPKIEKLMTAYTTASSAKEKNDMLKAVIERIDYEKTTRYDDNSLKLYIYPVLKVE